ncbi:MAG: carboxypeptidase M32 [Candidatus Thermoplasmatota archaeon]|nr:carboxypeptidase M32 [Candidatus Thermoplasmatota archaeon]
MEESLKYIYKEQKELTNFGGIAALLGWDQMTYMPLKGSGARAEQLSLISRLAHERAISDELYTHLKTLKDAADQLDERDRIIVTRLAKDIEKARKVPSAFVEQMSRVTSLAYMAWQEAREKNTFSSFAPHLETIIELEQQYIEYVRIPGHPYNSLLDDCEEGMTVDVLQREFHTLRSQLVDLLGRITASTVYQHQKPLKIQLTIDQQRELCTSLLKQLAFPMDRARLDVSTHPFTTSMADDDVRITTNYEKEGLLSSLFSTMHEAGHALYELGLPQEEYKDTVISDAPSLGLHESQSRFWENMIARSQPFWTYFTPVLNTIASDAMVGTDERGLYKAMNQVRPSFIRIEADELTYCLHVILRFELELDLITGKITVAELPGCWNQKMTEFFGITPPTDKEGVLQDMHWSGGEFGYFPTYAIGTMYASQLFKQYEREHPTVHDDVSQGQFTPVVHWLHEHVHRYGRLLTADEIIKKTCGEGLNSTVFVTYLKEKYCPLYDI